MVLVATTVFNEYGYPFELAVQKLCEMGVKAVELGGYGDLFTSVKYWKLLKQVAEEYEIKIVGVYVPNNVGNPLRYISKSFTSGSDEWVNKLRSCLEMCNEIGASFLTILDGILPDGFEQEKAWRWLVETIRKGAMIAEENRILIVDEFHIDMFTGNLETAPRLIDDVESNYFKACLDLSHADLITDGNPEKFIITLGNRIGHVHLTDCDGTKWRITQPTHLPIGMGRIDINHCIQTIKKMGYNGHWSLCLYGFPFPEWGISNSLKALKQLSL